MPPLNISLRVTQDKARRVPWNVAGAGTVFAQSRRKQPAGWQKNSYFMESEPERHEKDITMKKGLTQICLGGNSLIRDALQLCRELGYAGLEILLTEKGELTVHSGPEDFAAIRKMSEEAGVEITSICGMGSLIDDDPAVVAAAKATIRKMLEAGEALGVDTILTTGGWAGASVPYDVAYDRILAALRDLKSDAERHRVNIGLENVWNKLFLSPLE